VAYSRWGNSRWYTYWLAQEHEDTRDTATFQICSLHGNIDFTAKELRQDIDSCVRRACLQTSDHERAATRAEGIELKGYMQSFLEDVEMDFPGDKIDE
jgi:hypothetical protein